MISHGHLDGPPDVICMWTLNNRADSSHPDVLHSVTIETNLDMLT